MRKTCLLFLVAGFMTCSWAGVTSCAASANGNALSSFGATSASNGCAAVDITYTNLSVTGGSKSGNGTAPTSGTVDLYSNGNNLYLDGIPQISGSGTENATIAFEAAANSNLAFSSLTLGMAAQFLSYGSSVTITEHLCLNAAQASVGGNCSAANFGTITEHLTSAGVSYTCSFGSAGVCLNGTSDEVTFSNMLHAPTTVAVSELVSVSSSGWVQLSALDNDFAVQMETPEPGTFGLGGLAIAGLVASRRKRARNS